MTMMHDAGRVPSQLTLQVEEGGDGDLYCVKERLKTQSSPEGLAPASAHPAPVLYFTPTRAWP